MRSKTIEYFKNLDYRILIEPYEEDEGKKMYMAFSKELGKYSCYGLGETVEEALESFSLEKDNYIEVSLKNGDRITEPEDYTEEDTLPSGVFNVRTSPQLHHRLIQQAKREGISLNLLVNQMLSSSWSINELQWSLEKQFRESLNYLIKAKFADIIYQLEPRQTNEDFFPESIPMIRGKELSWSY